MSEIETKLTRADRIKYKNKYKLWKVLHPNTRYVCEYCKYHYGMGVGLKSKCPPKVIRMYHKSGQVVFVKNPRETWRRPLKSVCLEFLRCADEKT